MANTPQKDVVYIDVEDDITAIIGKLKTAKHSIVALVPPKRTGVLQSAVNLRLLARAADQHDKRLVIITGNHALSSLAAAAQIPVAKNLQSKPELGEIAALDVDNGEEIIDGAQLPVGEHAKQAGMDDEEVTAATALGAAALNPTADVSMPKVSSRKKSKVPNFDTFRKKLFLGGALAAFLIVFLIWALWFAPHATVILSTRTTKAGVSQQVTLTTEVSTDAEKGTIKAALKNSSDTVSIPFSATGKKDVGEKATGVVTFSTGSIYKLGTTIPAGTELSSSSGSTYVTDESVTMTLNNFEGAPVGITATASGTSYNGASGSASGAPSGIDAEITTTTSGGTDKTITVVTQADIDTAKKGIDKEIDKNTAKQTLSKQFGDGYTVIADSFSVDTSDITSSVAVGSEAPDAKAELKGDAKYSLYAVSDEELSNYLDAVITQQIDKPDEQKIYSNGADKASFSEVQRIKNGVSAALAAEGEIGPKIDESQVRQMAAGKNYGEIQQDLVAISGVDNADIKFSPFWVTHAPKDTNKISVEFKLNEQ